MDDVLRRRVRAAAVAAWWTLLAAAAFVTLQWLLFLGITHAQPAFVLTFWGPGATWEHVRSTWFESLLLAKLTLWPIAIAAAWLTLWARQLGRPSGGA